IVKVVELAGFTGVEPCTATLPTAGSMSASVASVEVHERVVESPLLICEGHAESFTVACAAAGAGAACVGGALATCFLQPPMNAKTVATPNKSVNFRIVPACIISSFRDFRVSLRKLPGYLVLLPFSSVTGPQKNCCAVRLNCTKPREPHAPVRRANRRNLFRRPVGRFVLTLERQLPRQAAIRQHGPDVLRAGARRFKNEVASVGRPTRPFIAALVARQFHELPGNNVHDIDIEITARASPAKCEQLSIW